MQGRSTEGKNLPPVSDDSFEKVALPVALEKGIGILAMKVTAQDNLVGEGDGKASMDRLLRYVLSLPVSVAVVGMPKIDYLLRKRSASARLSADAGQRDGRIFIPNVRRAQTRDGPPLLLPRRRLVDRLEQPKCINVSFGRNRDVLFSFSHERHWRSEHVVAGREMPQLFAATGVESD